MEPPSSRRVSVLDPLGFGVPTEAICLAVDAALASNGLPHGQVCVLLTDDDEIRRLNARFRGVDEATDVLTFPSGDPDPLGDVAIAVPYGRRQADRRGVALDLELAYLALHGALHLAGWDDESDAERDAMLVEMNRIARSVGLPEDHAWGSLLHGEAA